MLTVDMMLKRAMKGELDLMGPATAVAQELMAIPDFGAQDDAPFAAEKRVIANFKKAVLMVAGSAVQKLMMTLAKEQEILMNIADMMIEVYVAESTLLRAEKVTMNYGEAEGALKTAMMKVYINDAADRIHIAGKNALNAFAEGDEQRMMLMGLRRFTKVAPLNTKELRQQIALKLIEENSYCF
jgi:hypothetical protein